MSSGPADSLPLQPEEWQTLGLQMIAFLAMPQSGLDANWWQELTGGECETTRRRLSRVDDGPYQGVGLKLEIDPLRTVWSLGPHIEPESLQERGVEQLLIGSLQERREQFCELMERWFEQARPMILRMTFGAHLFLPRPDQASAYATLSRFVRSVQFDEGMSDFQFRINRKRASSILNGVEVNRVSMWTVAKITLDGPFGKASFSEQNGCSVVLDINTVPQDSPIDNGLLPALLRELSGMATEIATRGDTP